MPGDYHLRNRLGYRLSRLSRLMQNRLEAQLAVHGLTRLKWCVLSGVGLEGHETPSDLAAHIGITRPAISRLLKTLTRDGLIERRLSEDDARSRRVSLTAQGRVTLDTCLPLVAANQAHFVAKISAAEQAMLSHVLQKLTEGETEVLEDF